MTRRSRSVVASHSWDVRPSPAVRQKLMSQAIQTAFCGKQDPRASYEKDTSIPRYGSRVLRVWAAEERLNHALHFTETYIL